LAPTGPRPPARGVPAAEPPGGRSAGRTGALRPGARRVQKGRHRDEAAASGRVREPGCQNLKQLTELAALFGAPLAMLAAFTAFGVTAAAQFRVFDVTADYIAGVATALLLLGSIHFRPIPAEHRKALSLLWLLRTGVTLGLMLAFESVYLIDARMYYLSGLALNDPFATVAFGEGTEIVRAIVALLKHVTTSDSAMKVMFSRHSSSICRLLVMPFE